MGKKILAALAALLVSATAYAVGLTTNNQILTDWMPEIGGAAIVILFFVGVSALIE